MGEVFRWEATDRTTGMVYREDERGLGSFTQLDATRLSRLSLYTTVAGGEIIGYKWPPGRGVYHFFDAEGGVFTSEDFNAV